MLTGATGESNEQVCTVPVQPGWYGPTQPPCRCRRATAGYRVTGMVTRCDPVLLLDTRGGARTRIAGIDIQLLQTWKLRDRVLDHLVGAVGSGARASWLRHSSRSRSCICSNLPAAAHRRKAFTVSSVCRVNSAVTSSSVAWGWAVTISRRIARPDSSILGGRTSLRHDPP